MDRLWHNEVVHSNKSLIMWTLFLKNRIKHNCLQQLIIKYGIFLHKIILHIIDILLYMFLFGCQQFCGKTDLFYVIDRA